MGMGGVILLGCALALGGCIGVSTINGPDGRPAYALDCGMDRQACLKRAGELCPAGYAVIDDSSRTVAAPISGGFFMANQEYLTVSCR